MHQTSRITTRWQTTSCSRLTRWPLLCVQLQLRRIAPGLRLLSQARAWHIKIRLSSFRPTLIFALATPNFLNTTPLPRPVFFLSAITSSLSWSPCPPSANDGKNHQCWCIKSVWTFLSYPSFTHAYNAEQIMKLRYKCPHFRILIIGRANAGKTTILEKACGVQQGTKPIIYDENGKLN